MHCETLENIKKLFVKQIKLNVPFTVNYFFIRLQMDDHVQDRANRCRDEILGLYVRYAELKISAVFPGIPLEVYRGLPQFQQANA
jgi:hypothetical protein